MGRPPSIQWYYKQYLGDNKVLAMDWDASGMHAWLLNLSIQEEPSGSIPNDMAVIRRWLRNPSDDVWRRVHPQIFAAWKLQDGRWFNSGMVATAERSERYRGRYETGTKNSGDLKKIEEEVKLLEFDVGSKEPPNIEGDGFYGDEWFKKIMDQHPRAERGQEAEIAVMEAVLWLVGQGVCKSRLEAAERILARTKIYREYTRSWPDKTMITGAAKWYRGKQFEQDEAVWRKVDGRVNKTQERVDSINRSLINIVSGLGIGREPGEDNPAVQGGTPVRRSKALAAIAGGGKTSDD